MAFLKRSGLCILLLPALLNGACSRHAPASQAEAGASQQTPVADAGSQAPVHGPGQPTAPAPKAIAAGDPNAVLSQLSLELRKYVMRTRQKPKDFEDFVANSHVQPPPPPADKKYAIQGAAVVLVKR